MAMARSHSVALEGTRGHIVEIEADIAAGLPAVVLVGLPDASLGEARDRCRAAVTNSRQQWPASKVTIGLSPASLPKFGAHYDLAIAAAVLAASRCFTAGLLERTLLLGELALDGRLRAVPGVLPAALAGARAGFETIVVPESNAPEASLVDDLEVVGLRSLRHLVAHLRGEPAPDDPPVEPLAGAGTTAWSAGDRLAETDLADVVGQVAGRVSLVAAAAGGHHLFLDGPPGVGKTMLAERLPGLLPDLDHDDAMEVTAVHSIAGALDHEGDLVRRPPFLDPHHTASKAALVGGGSKVVRPGAMSLAHHGVLFLDEAPEFNRDVLEALRQPLESGRITIARAARTAEYPAAFQLVLAANPCPCGMHSGRADLCSCTPHAKRRYQEKISGPVRDRIDVQRTVENLSVHRLRSEVASTGTSVLAPVVATARDRQRARLADSPWNVNAQVSGAAMRSRWPLDGDAEQVIDDAVSRTRVSPRSADRVVRLAWTVADLVGSDRPGAYEARTALQLRLGGALDGRLVELVGG